MSFRPEARDAVAGATLEICKELGATLRFSNNGEPSITLYGGPEGESRSMGDVAESDAEETERSFSIPRQLQFPPVDGISINAVVTFEDYEYRVATWSADSLGALYTLNGIRTRLRRNT